MATGVNVKMGVSGVSKFKQDINAVKQSVKTMDQALALNEKQFKATGDAEEYMRTKAELLETKMAAQKSVIADAERALKQMTDQGVDKASKAFQEMQRTLLQAQGELIDTEQALKGIDDNSEEAANGVDSMNTQLKSIGKQVSFETVTNGIGAITDKMEAAAKWAWKLGDALVKNVLGAGSWADELKTLSDQTGIDVETLQRMEKTARVIDTDVDTILTAQSKLKKGTAEASEGVMGAFAALKIDPSTAKNAEDLFWMVGEGLLKLDDEYDQEAYAQKLFGKSWKELMPLFKAGRKEYDDTMKSWNVLSTEQVENLGKMDDSYQKMSEEWETFKKTVLETISGPMTKILDTLSGLLKRFNEYLATPEGKEMLEAMGNAVSSLVEDLVNIDPEKVVEGLAGVFNKITEAFKWIDEHKDDVVNAMKVIVGGWAALKLTGGALQVLQLINGVKGMTIGGGSGASAGAAAAAGGTTLFSGLKKVAGAAAKAVPWLAGLNVLTKNAFTPQGNDDLWDENGNPTETAKKVGITQTYDEYNKREWTDAEREAARVKAQADWEDMKIPKITDLFMGQTSEALKQKWMSTGANWAPSYMGGMKVPTQVTPYALNQAPSYMGGGYNAPTHSDLQEFNSLPAEMQQAVMAGIQAGMANVTIVIDGPQMTSAVGGMMGSALNRMVTQ